MEAQSASGQTTLNVVWPVAGYHSDGHPRVVLSATCTSDRDATLSTTLGC